MTAQLRTMEVPANRSGLTPGIWLRWTELRQFLEQEHVEQAVIAAIGESIGAKPISERAITVRT